MLHHDLVPEHLRLLHGLAAEVAPLGVPEEGAVELCLPDDVLDEQGVIYGEHPAAQNPFQDGFLESDELVQQAEGGLVQLLHLAAQGA